MNTVDKCIRTAKKQNRSLFRRINIGKNFWLNIVYGLLLSSVLAGYIADFTGINILIVMFMVAGIVAVLKQIPENHPAPEAFRPNQAFVGLYSAANDAEDEKQRKWDEDFYKPRYIPRKAEKDYLKNLVESVFQKHSSENTKKEICLVGASGCGKSVLLDMLVEELDEDKIDGKQKYRIERFENLYYEREEARWEAKTKKSENEQFFIGIFDQFEQVLQFDREDRILIFSRIRRMEEDGALIIYSLREEYLQMFVGTCLMEKSADGSMQAEVVARYLIVPDKNPEGTDQGSPSTNGIPVCADCKFEPVVSNIEWIVPELLMLDSRHNILTNEGMKKNMLHRCSNTFGKENGAEIYKKVEGISLIEQQIILNMMSQDTKLPSKAEEAFREKKYMTMMECYYDVQLCSTGAYFTACRILYFLSQARMDNYDIRKKTLKEAVCVAGGKETEQFERCLKSLKNMHLLREKNSNMVDKSSYEVSHDFIAQSFVTYANETLSSDVRTALDDYHTSHDLSVQNWNGGSGSYEAYEAKKDKDSWITIVWLLSLAVVLFRFAIQRILDVYGSMEIFLQKFVSLPATLQTAIQRTDHLFGAAGSPSVAVMVLSGMSLFYIYNYYRNISQFYGIAAVRNAILIKQNPVKRKRRWVVTVLYYLSMISGVIAAYAGNYWLLFLGLGNLFNGLSSIFISLDGQVSANGRSAYLSYGAKTAICSALMITGSAAASAIQNIAGTEIAALELIQQLIMTTLLIYSYHQHMEQKFFYVRVQALFNEGRSA